jgi:hypothetical protein
MPFLEALEPRLLLSGTSSVECLDLTATAGLIQLEYDMPDLQIEQIEAGEAGPLSQVVLGDARLTGGTGQVMLPSVTTQVVIPYGYELADILVETGERIVLDGQYTLTEGDMLIASDGVTTAPMEWIDRSNGYEIVGLQGRRGVDILVLNFYPVEYSLQAGTLSYFDSMNLSVQLAPGDSASGQSQDILYRADEIRPLSDQVDNPAALASYEAAEGMSAAPLGSLVDPADTYDYVIITNNALATASADYDMADFIAHKQSLGFDVAMVTVEDIYANYTGVDQQEQIRNFIIDAYNGWETDFVLLAGDWSVIPLRKLLVPGNSPDLIDSDMYYQGLDGNFNADGDGYYGEYNGDNPDYVSDVYLGRAVFGDVTKMSNWVYKTITYENSISDPYRYNALMVGEFLGLGGGVTEYSKESLEQLRTWYFNQDPDFQVDTLYEKDQAWGPTEIIAEMNSDTYAIYNHLGHSNGGIVMQTHQDDFDAYLTNENFFFAYSQGCWPGYLGPGGSVAEHLTTHTRHGAAALMFNSTFGWYYPGYLDGPSHVLNRQFWDAMFGEGINQIGAMNADSHEDNLGDIGTWYIQAVIYGTTIFGDPSLEIVSLDLAVGLADPDWAYQGEAYSWAVEGKNGTKPYVDWTLVGGSLPAGLSLNPTTGVISGTPTATGEYTFTVQITDAASDTATREFTLPVLQRLAITTAAVLPDCHDGSAYSVFVAATGGTSPYTFELTDGALPSGLGLNQNTGEVFGTTTSLGEYIFSIQVADSNGTYPQTDVVEFTLSVTQPPATISGQVFNDLDGDGQRDSGELGLNGWTVQLVDVATDTVVATTVSASVDLDENGTIDPATETGTYSFTADAGAYEVRQVAQAGFDATTSWIPPGRTFAVEDSEGVVTIYEFDPLDWTILNSFAPPAGIIALGYQGLAVGPDSLFYVDSNDLMSPTLWELDLDTGAVIDSDPLTFGFEYYIKGMAYHDGELYIQFNTNRLAVWDPTTDSHVRTMLSISGISGGLTGTSDLDVLYGMDPAGEIVSLNPADGAVLATVSTGLSELHGGLAYYDGDLVAVSSSDGATTYRIDPLTGAILDSTLMGTGIGNFVGLGGDAGSAAVAGAQGVTVDWDDSAPGLDLGNQWLGLRGDMNDDAVVDAMDIDLLHADLGDDLGVHPKFDLDGDGDADRSDVDELVRDVLNTEYGDNNLDGYVDATDLANFKAGFGGPGGWLLGDYNGDGLVDGTDLAIFKAYFGFFRLEEPVEAPPIVDEGSASATLSVTEPSATTSGDVEPDPLDVADPVGDTPTSPPNDEGPVDVIASPDDSPRGRRLGETQGRRLGHLAAASLREASVVAMAALTTDQPADMLSTDTAAVLPGQLVRVAAGERLAVDVETVVDLLAEVSIDEVLAL